MLKKFFTYLLIFSFVAGQLIRLDIFWNFVPLLDVSAALFIAYHVLTKQFSWKRYFQQKWLLVFIGVLIASNTINWGKYTLNENVAGNLYLIRFVIYSLLIGVNFKISWPKINIIGLIVSVIGILQFIFYHDFGYLKYQNWDEHFNRLAFPYLDPSFTGAILLIFVIINIFIRGATPRRATTLILTTELIAIFLTFSRATWITGAIILFVIICRRRGIRSIREIGGIVPIICIIVAISILLGKSGSYGNQLLRHETILSRTSSLQKGMEIWQKNPIFGVGFNHYKSYLIKSVADRKIIEKYQESHGLASVENSFVFVMATGGLIGLIFFLIWIKPLLYSSDLSCRFIFVSILVSSLFDNIFFYPFILLIIFMIISTQQSN